jgi:hypothetical protein
MVIDRQSNTHTLKYTHYNQKGFTHYIVLAGFLVLFAVVGVFFLIKSDAAATTYHIELSGSITDYCLTNAGDLGIAKLMECNSGVDDSAVITNLGANIAGDETAYITVGGQCMQQQASGAVYFTGSCSDTQQDEWILGSTITSVYDYRSYEPPVPCIGADTLNGVVASRACTGSTPYKSWERIALGSAVTITNPSPTKFSVNLAGQSVCYNNTYTTADVKIGSDCVAALQYMLNYMRPYDGGGKTAISEDGYYGSATYTQVRDYQVWEKRSAPAVSVDGRAGTQTWQYMCWSGRVRKFNTTRAYYYAECEHRAPPAGKKNP